MQDILSSMENKQRPYGALKEVQPKNIRMQRLGIQFYKKGQDSSSRVASFLYLILI